MRSGHALHVAGKRRHSPDGKPTCALCGYFRSVVLPSGHVRTFCAFTGEKLPASHPACSFLLTEGGLVAMIEAPNYRSHNRRLFLAPQGKKFCPALQRLARAVFGVVLSHIGRVQRPGSREAPAAICRPGSVVTLPFFIPKLQRFPHVFSFPE